MAEAFGLPAAALVGSTVAVTSLCAFGFNAWVPAAIRDLGFTMVGISLGAAITPTFLEGLVRWPASLAAMTFTLALTMILSSSVLIRWFGLTRSGALLSVSPGALSYAIALARDDDLRPVMVVQSLRLLAVTLLLPPLIAASGPDAAAFNRTGPEAATLEPAAAAVTYVWVAVLLTAGFGLGRMSARIGVPAAYLLSGLLLSGSVHGAAAVPGSLPAVAALIGFVIVGTVVGARFREITKADVLRYGLAGASVAMIGILITGATGLLLAPALGMPFGQIWLAYAPGGVEALAAMALSLGYDPVFVAIHHIARFLALLFLLPLVLRLARK